MAGVGLAVIGLSATAASGPTATDPAATDRTVVDRADAGRADAVQTAPSDGSIERSAGASDASGSALGDARGVAVVEVRIEGPQPARGIVERALAKWEASAPPRDAFGVQRARTQARRLAAEALATEGWFSPQLGVEDDGRRVTVAIEPGERTTIADVDIAFSGMITDAAGRERRDALRRAWRLAPGQPFRQDEWAASKRELLDGLLAEDFAAAQLVDSRAEIDADAARASLAVAVDSGPRFTFGTLLIEGLSSYDRSLVERYTRIRPGDPYRADALLALQTALQNTPYFGSVLVEIDRDPSRARNVPVVVRVTEALPKRASFGFGYSTNTGVRGETTFRNADFLNRAWALESGVRIEQLRQLGFATVRLPPNRDDSRDALTLLAERSDIQNLMLRRVELGATRTLVRGPFETRLSLNLQRELRAISGADERAFKALTANWSWTWRGVDDLIDPRQGTLVNLQVGGGAKALLSDQDFVRGYLRAQRFWTVRGGDVFSLRAIAGVTLAPSREGIPQTFLFRTGGSTTVRGYGFESLGVREGDAVVGGRYLAVAGAEYVRWFTEKWGGAAFVDVGDAADRRSDWRPAVGTGVGVRFRSPLGPLALDVAWGERARRLRLHVAIAVAF